MTTTADRGVLRGRQYDPGVARLPIARWEWFALTALVFGFLALGLYVISRGAPLGHDEAVYALRSRFYAVNDLRGGYWHDYRAVGLPMILAPMWLLSGTEPYLRSVVLAFGALGVVATWAWTRLFFGRAPAIIAASMLVVTPGYFIHSTLVNVDVPATTVALATLLVFAFSSTRSRISLWALSVIPLVAIATAMRYGAPLVLGAGLAGVAVSHWRAVWRSRALTLVIAGGALAAAAIVLMVPAVTGSRTAPLRAVQARQVSKGLPWWSSAQDFMELLPRLLGPLGLVIAIGCFLALIAVLQGRAPVTPIAVNFLVATAFLILLNVGLGHGEARYLFPALPFVYALVGAGIAVSARMLPTRVAISGLALGVLVSSIWVYGSAMDSTASLQRFSWLRSAARELGSIYGPECAVITSYTPQVAWYSGCEARPLVVKKLDDVVEFRLELAEKLHEGFLTVEPQGNVTALLVSQGKRQPQGEAGAALESLVERDILAVGDPDGGRLMHVRVVLLGRLADLQGQFPYDPAPDEPRSGEGS